MKRFDVLTIGLQVIDLMIPGMDGHILDREMTLLDHAELTLGGDALNQAIVLSQLGARTALMGAAGVDRLGDVLLQQLSRYPLSVFDRRIDVPTAICVVLIDEAHERHFLFQSGQNLALRYEDLDEAVIRDSAFVSVGGAMALPELDGEGLLKLFTLAHASGARTALDMRVSEREYDHALLEACFRKTDYFLPSEREAVWLTGETGSPEKMAQALHKMGAANCVIKLGAQGCYVSADGIEAHIPSFPCRCVDTTGAGDTFAGSFLYAKSQGRDTLASAKFACAAGSVAVEHVGANTAIRSKDQPGPDERTIKLQTTCLKAQAGGFFLYYRMDMNHSTVLGS